MKWEEWISLGNYIDVQGVKTFYVEKGKGKTLLFLHGWGASSYSWRNNLLFLSQKFRTIAIDLKGFGLTEKPNGNYDLDEFTEHVKNFIEYMALNKVNLAGNSMGGGIAINLAYKYNEMIDKIVLIDSTVIANNNTIPFLFRIVSIKPIGELLSFFMINKKVVINTLNQVYYDKSKINEEIINGYYKPLKLKGMRRVLLNSLRNIRKFNVISSYLDKLDKECLIIWGENDPWLPVKQAYAIHKRIKNSSLIVIPKAGHVPHEEKSEIVNELIINFINQQA